MKVCSYPTYSSESAVVYCVLLKCVECDDILREDVMERNREGRWREVLCMCIIWMDGWMDGWMGGWVDGWMGGWVDGWMDGWMGGCSG